MSAEDNAFIAVEEGDVTKLKAALAQDANNLKDSFKSHRNLLHLASELGQNDCVAFLLENGFDIEAATTDLDGYHPLHLCVRKGHLETTRLLIDKGADFNAKDKYQATPLHKACRARFIGIIRLLIEKGVDLNIGDNNDWTPLHRACASGDMDILDVLVEGGCNVEKGDISGGTAMHIAADSGRVDAVTYLLSKGANSCIVDQNGASPLFRACRRGHQKTVAVLLEADPQAAGLVDNEGRTGMHIAAEEGHGEVVRELITASSLPLKIDLVNRAGLTALDSAVEKGQLGVVKILMEDGGAAMNETGNGTMPTIFRCCKDTGNKVVNQQLLEVLEYLIRSRNANIRVTNPDGFMPLHYAAQYGTLEMVQCLVWWGRADPEEPGGKGGRRPADLALPFRTDIVKFLESPDQHSPPAAKELEQEGKMGQDQSNNIHDGRNVEGSKSWTARRGNLGITLSNMCFIS